MRGRTEPAKRPNVLVLLSDEHNPRFSQPYGHPFLQTPNLQRLAESGVTFENAYTPSPLCVPARMAFMTGRYPHRCGAWDNGCTVPSDQPTWAHRLNRAGYHTALAGKMHFNGPDQVHGFRSIVQPDLHAKLDGIGVVRPWGDAPLNAPLATYLDGAGPGDAQHVQHDLLAEQAAARFLLDPARREEPWALCVSFVTPHFPLLAPRELFERYYPAHADLPDEPAPRADEHPHRRRNRQMTVGLHERDEDTIRRARAAYYALVTYLDQRVGEVLAALEQSGQAENTVVVYTSDHGELLGEQGQWFKNCLDEDAVRVPLLVRPAGGVSGRRVPAAVSLIDVTRSLLELAGADTSETDGASLLPLLAEDTAQPAVQWAGEVLVEYEGHVADAPMRMVRQGKWKLAYYHEEPSELFNLDDDPHERRNLWNDPRYAFVRDRLLSRVLAGWDPEAVQRGVHASQRARALVGHTGLPTFHDAPARRPPGRV